MLHGTQLRRETIEAIDAAPQPELTDPEAAEGVELEGLDCPEAASLITEVFEPEIQNPAGIFDELEVERFVTNNVAVIGAGDEPDLPGRSRSFDLSWSHAAPVLGSVQDPRLVRYRTGRPGLGNARRKVN